MVQEKMSCNRQPVPIRHLQPLSQGLSALTAPLTQGSQGAGISSAGQPTIKRGSQALRGTKARNLPLFGQKEAGFREKHGTARHGLWVDSTKKRPA